MRVLYIVEHRGELGTRLVCIRLGKRGDEPVERSSELRRWQREDEILT